jgi:hypothetical protein
MHEGGAGPFPFCDLDVPISSRVNHVGETNAMFVSRYRILYVVAKHAWPINAELCLQFMPMA